MPAFSQEKWSDREICRAATKTYFWLNELPTDAPDNPDYMGFRSNNANYYTCRVVGRAIHFVWLNQSAESMQSQSTKFELDEGRLTIISDIKTEKFIRE